MRWIYKIQNFTWSTQFDYKIATIEAIWMIFASFERVESQLLIDAKIAKAPRIKKLIPCIF